LYVVGFEGDLPNLFCHINNCYPNSASNKQKKKKENKTKVERKKENESWQGEIRTENLRHRTGGVAHNHYII